MSDTSEWVFEGPDPEVGIFGDLVVHMCDKNVDEEPAPEGDVTQYAAINPALVKRLCTSEGEWTDPVTGELLEVPGIGITEQAARLVVTTTDAAEEWARSALGAVLMPPSAHTELEAGR